MIRGNINMSETGDGDKPLPEPELQAGRRGVKRRGEAFWASETPPIGRFPPGFRRQSGGEVHKTPILRFYNDTPSPPPPGSRSDESS
jgi:hypothetical protein